MPVHCTFLCIPVDVQLSAVLKQRIFKVMCWKIGSQCNSLYCTSVATLSSLNWWLCCSGWESAFTKKTLDTRAQNGFLGFSRSFLPFSVWIYVPLSLLWILILHQFFPTNQLAWHRRIGNSLWTADIFPVVASLSPKNNVRERDRQNDFHDLKPFVLMFANQIKGEKAIRVTPRDLVLWCVLDFGESYQVRFGTWISRLQQGFLRCWMLASWWSNGFLSYVCDVGLWFHFIKYGIVVHSINKTWTKKSLQQKENIIA